MTNNLPPASGANGVVSGSRSAAGMFTRKLTDTIAQAWNSVTGNVLVTGPVRAVTHRYDNADRLIALAEPGDSCPAILVFPNTTKCTGFTYDNDNRRPTTSYPNGVENTTVYDIAGRIRSITSAITGATVLTKRTYTYTTNGTRDGVLRKTKTTNAGAVTTYAYDAVNRPTSAVAGSITDSWTYDANGNRLTAAKTGTGTATDYYAYNAADQMRW